MYCLLDEHLDDEVGSLLTDAGFSVQRARDVFGQGAPDPRLASWVSLKHGVIATCNCVHFRKYITRRLPHENKQRFKYAGAIFLQCEDHLRGRRIRRFISVLSAEREKVMQEHDSRLIVWIEREHLRIDR